MLNVILIAAARPLKVETIGDCYMAAAGIPEPRPDHALAMAQFALTCKAKMTVLALKLEKYLGPGKLMS